MTAPLPLHILFDAKLRRDDVELFGDDLIDSLHVLRAARTDALCLIGIDEHLDAREMLGNRRRPPFLWTLSRVGDFFEISELGLWLFALGPADLLQKIELIGILKAL